jgi:hypothetical protein
MALEEWLIKLNKEFRAEGIEIRRRPFDAIMRYSKEFDVSISLSSDLAKKIFKWFEAHSKPGAHHVGSLYNSVYYYDSQFWPISIPITYGTVELNALKSLGQMPDNIIDEMMSDKKQAWDYMAFWADCVDYGLGIDDMEKTTSLDNFGMQLLRSGDQELRAATAMLNQHRYDPRAIFPCRMALEMFLKSFIALKQGLTEKEAKSLGHNLDKGFSAFIEASGYNHFEDVRSMLKVFPQISERYKAQSIPGDKLWNGFSIAQSFGALIVREHTDRRTLAQITSSNKGN